MPRPAIALLISAFVTSLLHGQDLPTFRAGTTLVEFTVVAVDGRGNPITDLKQDELELRAGGRVHEIAFFRFDGAPIPPTVPPPALPSGFVTNTPPPAPSGDRSATVIVMDLLNTAPNEHRSVQQMTAQYLQAIPGATRLAVYEFSEDKAVTIVQELTEDIARVRDSINALRISSRRELARGGHTGSPIVGGDCYLTGGPMNAPPSSGGGAATGSSTAGAKAALTATALATEGNGLAALNKQIRDARLEKTLATLDALATHLSAIPGRKNVIWITSGMPVMLKGYLKHNYEPQIRASAQRLANKGIVVYPVDAKGLCRAGDMSTTEGGDGSHDAPQLVYASLEAVAETTGGRFLKNTNNPADGIAAAAADQRGTYTIGFYVTDQASDAWQRLEVSAKRQGVSLRHRQGYFTARRAQAQSWQADDWGSVAKRSLVSTDIRLNARSALAANTITVSLQVAAADVYFHQKDSQLVADLELGLIEMGRDGPTNLRAQPMEISMAADQAQQRGEWIAVETKWPVGGATSLVRVVVRDRFTGRYGTLDLPIAGRQP